ncbi:MAG: TauD/TfdA family dioxygenase [Alphaproteobacteria bacterium]
MVQAVRTIQRGEAGLEVIWETGEQTSYPWFWLRDHATDAQSYDSRSGQRELYTAGLDPAIRGLAARLGADGRSVEIDWPDGPQSVAYDTGFLWRFRAPAPAANAPDRRRPWDRAKIAEAMVEIPYAKVMANEAGLLRLLETIETWGFAVLTESPAKLDSVAALAGIIGYVRETIFGGLWEFEANEARADSAYTPNTLRPHTDSTYSHDAPGVQILLCLDYQAEGGDSLIVDGLEIGRRLAAKHPADYATLGRIAIPGQYLGDGAHLMAERPVFRHDRDGRILQVSFNNYDRAPFRLPEPEMTELYRAIAAFDRLANDPALQWRRGLRPGDLLIFDNWRVLHARTAYSGKRRMAGCYLNREDFESRLRLLREDD